MKISNEEYEKAYRQYGPMVLRRCRYLLKDEEKALDAMQDVFVHIFEQQKKIDQLCSSLFFTTATRICLNLMRYDRYRSGPDFETVAATIQDSAAAGQEDSIDVTLVLECIFNGRNPKDKEIAILHYVDDFTWEDTAKQMKMSVPGVRKRMENLKKHAAKHFGV